MVGAWGLSMQLQSSSHIQTRSENEFLQQNVTLPFPHLFYIVEQSLFKGLE